MQPLVRLLLAGLGAGAVSLSAQTTVGDDFSTDSGRWEADVTAVGGALLRSGGALHFTDGGLATGQTSYAYREWSVSAPANAGWQVQVDFTLALSSQAAGQVTMWSLYAAALTGSPPDDYLVAELNQNYMQSGFRILNATRYTDGVAVDTMGPQSITAGSIALQIAYDAGAQTLTLGYDADAGAGGYSFTTLDAVSTATWLLGASDQFGFRIQGSNTAQAGASGAINVGQTLADNFLLTGAAIPEPATAAAGLGLLALGFGLRRRIPRPLRRPGAVGRRLA